MTLSPTTKKTIHTGAVAFASGALSYISVALATGHLPSIKSFLIGSLAGGVSRLAGWALARLETA